MSSVPSLPEGYLVERIDIAGTADAALTSLVEVVNVINAEREPRAVALTVDEFRTFTSSPGTRRNHRIVTDDHGTTVGYLTTRYPDDGTNPDLLAVSIGVQPDHRRRGIATALLGVAVEDARDLGRTRLTGQIYDTVAAAGPFTRAVGVEGTHDMHINTMRVDRLDQGLLARWTTRSEGYSVRLIDGMFPEELLEGLVPLFVALDRDSPRPEGEEPRNWTAELIRDWAANLLHGVDLIAAIAVEDSSGAPVATSQLARRRNDESTWSVTFTMVDPAHRGKGLGKWVKAASCLAALERWPGGERMETGNAFANDPMLAINHAMGFRHEYTVTEVSVAVDRAADFVASKSR